jgi:hypothetical protein
MLYFKYNITLIIYTMFKETEENNLILGLDISTATIGIALFEDLGDRGKLKLLHHISPKVKPVPITKIEELFRKAKIFEEEFINKYAGLGIYKVIIEEPLLRSNNVNTVATLLRFNGMIAKAIFETLGVVPEFISSYDSRRYAYPELMAIRTKDKKGIPYPEKELKNKKPTLFGAYDWDIDKKMVVWEKVAALEPQVSWFYDKNKKLKKESFDSSDAYTCVLAACRRSGKWK